MLTTKEAAKILGITPNRIWQLINAGKIKAEKIGRDYFIEDKDLEPVLNRIPGNPYISVLNNKLKGVKCK